MSARLFLFLVILVLAAGPARAQFVLAYETPATVCPAMGETAPPDFSGPDCSQTTLLHLDPQQRDIWVRVMFETDPSNLSQEGPLGLFLSVKASSEVWLNGSRLGANGQPGPDKRSEIPGRMDAVFYAPHDLLRDGENEIAMRLSAHRGLLRLNYPFHFLAFHSYADPSREILRAYWPSLITFGAFLLGAIYFGVSAVRSEPRGAGAVLFILSLIAIAQLGLETARGLFPYAYPFHDIRLIAITAGAASFGLCLLFHVASRFLKKRRLGIFAAGIAATALAAALPKGFDARAIYGLLTPLVMALGISLYAVFGKQLMARAYAVALGLFITLMVIMAGEFLDRGFFYAVAALLLFLMAQQAATLSKERLLRRDASDRARRLEIALEQARERQAPERLKIQSGGKTELIAAGDIVYCKGAGDYVEIALADGSKRLHLAKLHELEGDLPQTFLRIHRSYIVNTDAVTSLQREANGVGSLALNNGESVPVSRRILPKVKSALT